ncbi:tRNA-splicing endonuclease subunit [Collichthys lucidus]|uniref:tRNA-splicing endonuclease subunit n=1 Tax=Collichthys lucidus TaxID=240159 RepID=A0A4U5VSS3_COLLU|nr:tRNA-splicing endonuclease subunit [Collichthys lucidus]
MADQNKPDSGAKFFSEILRGNLVKATWIPSEQRVELQSPAGKFWQTMGFSANGKQHLLPEEALYLMECGNLQVFYRDLPLSIQDGYERFLSSSTVSLQQYQVCFLVCDRLSCPDILAELLNGSNDSFLITKVFGHLKRLGYVVHRFDPSSVPSSYARQLNLPPSRDRAGKQLKRKRSASPTLTSGRTEVQDESTAVRMEEDECDEEKDKKLLESHLTSSPGTSGTQTAAQSSADEDGSRTWWMTDVLRDRSDPRSASGCTHWDFGSIPFPDLGSSGHHSSSLSPPDPSLLPGSLAVGACDVAPWRRRINLREVKMSSKEQTRDKDKHRWDINRDREVRRCRNWAEYRELLARREGKRKGRPAHLWNREVTPLHDPTRPITTEELLDKISVTESTHLLEGASRLKASDEWRICFNVYQPDTVADFKKSSPGKPYSRMCVCSFDGPVPDLRAVKLLAFQSGDVPVVFAVVDHGDISFYTFKDFQLPTDVQP